jgi:hypothetical protein
MAIPSRQIGWSQKANLLWQISKQLEKLTQVAGNVVINPSTTTTTTTVAVSYLTTENNDQLITENNDFIILN